MIIPLFHLLILLRRLLDCLLSRITCQRLVNCILRVLYIDSDRSNRSELEDSDNSSDVGSASETLLTVEFHSIAGIALTEPVILLSREIIGDSVGFAFLNPVPYCRGAIFESPVEWELLGHVIDNNEASCSSKLPRIPTTLFPSLRFCDNAAGLVRSSTDH